MFAHARRCSSWSRFHVYVIRMHSVLMDSLMDSEGFVQGNLLETEFGLSVYRDVQKVHQLISTEPILIDHVIYDGGAVDNPRDARASPSWPTAMLHRCAAGRRSG